MDSLSLSNSISKETKYENTELSTAYFEDLKGRGSDTISNERIQNGDRILETYEVTSDAIYGGMGSVWRVHHQSWNTDLAMKRPQPRFFAEGGDAKKAQFVSECENWINLGLHPNIVSCYYVREIGGVPTIFSEWMDGGSLSDRIKDGSLYEGTETEIQERILDIAIQAARGLQYSHENGLIHQDFKPGNLLLTKEWDAKVADFGLAKAKSNLGDKSDTAKTTGYTLAYCPQEQVDREEPQKWMDVYSWALTVLEMYAGKRLWQTGADAKERFDEYVAQCVHKVPSDIQMILKACVKNKTDDLTEVERKLENCYREVKSTAYERPVAKASDTADILNNKALSFIDLGMQDEAENILEKAIFQNAKHAECLYNYALLKWRRCKITDLEALHILSACDGDMSYGRLVSRLELERGNPDGIRDGADENDRGYAETLPSLDQKKVRLSLNGTSQFLEMSPDEDQFLVADRNKTVLFDVEQGREIWSLHDNKVAYRTGAVNWEKGELCSDYAHSVVRSIDDMTNMDDWDDLLMVDFRHNKPLHRFRLKNRFQLFGCRYESDTTVCIVFNELVSVNRSRSRPHGIYTPAIALIDIENDEVLWKKELPEPEMNLNTFYDKVLILKDRKVVKIHSSGLVTFYDANTGEVRYQKKLYGYIRSLTVNKDENVFLVSTDNGLIRLDVRTGEEQVSFPSFVINCYPSHDGKIMLKTGDRIEILDSESGRCLRSMNIDGERLCCGKEKIIVLSKAGAIKELFFLKRPVFGYTASWELTRIRSSSQQIKLEQRFLQLLNDARQACEEGQYDIAFKLIEKARSLDAQTQFERRAMMILSEIGKHCIKKSLKCATLMQTIEGKGTISFVDENALRLDQYYEFIEVSTDTGTIKKTPKTNKRVEQMISIPKGFQKYIEVLSDKTLVSILSSTNKGNHDYKIICWDIEGRQLLNDYMFSLDSQSILPLIRGEILRDQKTLLMEANVDLWDKKRKNKKSIRRLLFWSVSEFKMLCEYDFVTGCGNCSSSYLLAYPDNRTTLIVINAKCEENEEKHLILLYWDSQEQRIVRELTVKIDNKVEYLQGIELSPDRTELLTTLKKKSTYQYFKIDLSDGSKKAALRHVPSRMKTESGMLCDNQVKYTGVGDQLFYFNDFSTVIIKPFKKGDPEIQIKGTYQYPCKTAISPEANYLAVYNGEDEVFLYQLEWEYDFSSGAEKSAPKGRKPQNNKQSIRESKDDEITRNSEAQLSEISTVEIKQDTYPTLKSKKVTITPSTIKSQDTPNEASIHENKKGFFSRLFGKK